MFFRGVYDAPSEELYRVSDQLRMPIHFSNVYLLNYN